MINVLIHAWSLIVSHPLSWCTQFRKHKSILTFYVISQQSWHCHMLIIPNCEFHGCWSLDNASSKVIIPMTMTSLYRNISVSAADGIIIIILIWCIDLIHSMYWFNTYGYLSVATRRYIIVIIIIYWEGCKWELMLQYIKVTAFRLSLKYICWFKQWWNLYSRTGSFKL